MLAAGNRFKGIQFGVNKGFYYLNSIILEFMYQNGDVFFAIVPQTGLCGDVFFAILPLAGNLASLSQATHLHSVIKEQFFKLSATLFGSNQAHIIK